MHCIKRTRANAGGHASSATSLHRCLAQEGSRKLSTSASGRPAWRHRARGRRPAPRARRPLHAWSLRPRERLPDGAPSPPTRAAQPRETCLHFPQSLPAGDAARRGRRCGRRRTRATSSRRPLRAPRAPSRVLPSPCRPMPDANAVCVLPPSSPVHPRFFFLFRHPTAETFSNHVRGGRDVRVPG